MSCPSLPHLPHRCSLLSSDRSWQRGQPVFRTKHKHSVRRITIIQAKGASSGEAHIQPRKSALLSLAAGTTLIASIPLQIFL